MPQCYIHANLFPIGPLVYESTSSPCNCIIFIPCWFSAAGPSLEVIKLFSCSTQLSMKFILLINVKMSTIVGILTFISMINATYERFNTRKNFNFQYFSSYKQWKFHAQLGWAWNKFQNLGTRCSKRNTLSCAVELSTRSFFRCALGDSFAARPTALAVPLKVFFSFFSIFLRASSIFFASLGLKSGSGIMKQRWEFPMNVWNRI